MLFERESPDWGAAIGWGMLYGITWWFVATLTLFPIWLGASFTWTTAALSSLLGHLIYGSGHGHRFSCCSSVIITTGCGSTRALPRSRRACNPLLAHRLLRSGFSR